ncbi:MAG: hypothetical protein Q8918_04030 [Bacteroidota bacterium]|nr:hypothetical protein [Bacteroidota bacterium]MDP4211932.1 hypothetical protein [Bacteroidota bacterium]MDP4249263.1 hypothetical protein [Bacteroidota bacterium]
MKERIKELMDMLKELVPETNRDRNSYNNMRLIPIPVKSQDQKRPNPYNTKR